EHELRTRRAAAPQDADQSDVAAARPLEHRRAAVTATDARVHQALAELRDVRAADRDVHAGVGDGPVRPAGRTAHLVYRATRDRVRPLRRDVEEAHHLERAREPAARRRPGDPAQVEADPAVVPRARAVAVAAAAAARTRTAREVPGIRDLDADRRRVHARR